MTSFTGESLNFSAQRVNHCSKLLVFPLQPWELPPQTADLGLELLLFCNPHGVNDLPQPVNFCLQIPLAAKPAMPRGARL